MNKVVLIAIGGILSATVCVQYGNTAERIPVSLPDTTSRDYQKSRVPPQPTTDIDLQWALEAAVESHPSVAASWYEIQASQGVLQQAGYLPNPRIFGEIEEFGGSGELSGADAMASRIGLSQEFLLGGKIHKRVKEAEAGTRVTTLMHQKKLLEFKAMVERRFYNVYTLQERLRLQEKQLDIIEKTHEVVRKRVESGDTTPIDLARSQVEVSSARIEVQKRHRELKAARHVLAESWGSESPDFTSVRARYRLNPHISEPELYHLLEQSPAWKLYEARTDRAEKALALSRAEVIPDLELEGGVQHFNESGDQALFIGVSLPLPLFDRNRGNITGAEATYQKVRQQKKAGALALKTELQQAWHRFISAQQTVRALEEDVLPAARDAYQSVRKSYQAGEADILALHDAQRTWVNIRENRIQLLHELENSRIDLESLTGSWPGKSAKPESISHQKEAR